MSDKIGFRGLSTLLTRMGLGQRAGMRFDGKRDYYDVFGWKRQLDNKDVYAKYERQEMAARIIDMPPEAVWSKPPMLTYDDDEVPDAKPIEAWEDVVEDTRFWSHILTADKMCRLEPYSLLFIGFADSGNVDKPVNKELLAQKEQPVLYVRAFGKYTVLEVEFDNDPMSARFGLPHMYTIAVQDPSSELMNGSYSSLANSRNDDGQESGKPMKVHWTRILHIVEKPLVSPLFGTPISVHAFNLLDDILKVTGGTAEMFWQNGRQGMQVDVDPEMELDEDDKAALSDEIEEWQHEVRRFMRTRGVNIKDLGGTPPNPGQTFDMQMAMLSATTGIPQRILLGAEAGQLASEQDRANWAERVNERRANFAEPQVIEQLIDRLKLVGLIEDDKVYVRWPPAFTLSPLEEGQMMAQKARAVGNLSRQGDTPMQITSRDEARTILGLTGDLPDEELVERKLPADVLADDDDPDDATDDSSGDRGRQSDDEEEGKGESNSGNDDDE